ncbi:lanthionine synthetase C family protein [Shewanella sp. 10N.286.54.B9]|uniref:lanthionine synthetase C family protein n=1 Tax=Shewanella sp. 10N.286.54.B9 TaxID=3229719 RepID=UPI003553448D
MSYIAPIRLSLSQQKEIKVIHHCFVASIINSSNIQYSFLDGRTGEIPYLYLVESTIDCDTLKVEQLINTDIDHLMAALSTQELPLGISNGVSGIGWTLEFLNQQQQDYDAELCDTLDQLLINHISSPQWHGEIEYVLGLAGIATYAARRLEHSNDYRLYDKVIGHYEGLAIRVNEEQLSWPQPTNSVFRLNPEAVDDIEFNLGLAHGVPGIIAAILPALAIPQLASRVTTLLIHSCNWLIEQQITTDEHKLTFPTAVGSKRASRLGWCYGDLTIALTLARVGQALNISSYIEVARDTAMRSSNKSASEGLINDGAFCHGSSGLITIFQLLNEILDEPQLEQAASNWLDFTLQLYKDNGLKGLLGNTDESDNHEQNSGFLMGYAGIGLALITATTGNADWADSLLLK